MNIIWAELTLILVIALRSATPLLAVVIGETLSQRSGVINLGVEGQMLVGALTGVVATLHTGSPTMGLLAGCAAGLTLSLLHAVLVLGFRANQIASGIAVLMLGTGVSAFYGIPYVGQRIERFDGIEATWLADIPLLGNLLAPFTPTVLLTICIVPLAAIFLYRTRQGLRWQAAGESPEISRNLGHSPRPYQLAGICLGGVLSGFGGAALSVDYTGNWVEGMTNGQGLLAVGLVIVARWNPWLTLPAALLFGVSQALNLRMQSWGVDISSYLLATLPYVLPMIVMALSYRSLKRTNGGMPQGLKIVFTQK